MTTRRCKDCGKEFPATKEYFWGRIYKGQWKPFARCKICETLRKGFIPLVWHNRPPEGMKRCAKCKLDLPATAEYFSPLKSRPGKFRARCKRCSAKAASDYYRQHNPIRPRKNTRKYEGDDQTRRKLICAAYYRSHPDAVNINTQRRNARKRHLPSTFSSSDWRSCLKYWHGCCAVCGRPAGFWHTIAQDHWVPVSKGGGYTPDNIVPLCHGDGGCNNSKNDSAPEEWLMKRFGKRKAQRILEKIQEYFQWVKDSHH